ncbi:MAG: hypothetical protein ACKV2O_08055 [Acidimicrobiales bacterium]
MPAALVTSHIPGSSRWLIAQRHAAPSFRPWWRWLLTAVAFPPSGLLAHVVVGPVDSVMAAALNGVIAGAGIGTAQWLLLRRWGVGVAWILATAAGLGTGLGLGAALVSYRTDIKSLALMGAVSGLGVGIAQAAMLDTVRGALGWVVATAALFALGWTITTAGGIDVSQQWAVFGAYGCTTVALVQSTFVRAMVADRRTGA